jgi:hypothetical protein
LHASLTAGGLHATDLGGLEDEDDLEDEDEDEEIGSPMRGPGTPRGLPPRPTTSNPEDMGERPMRPRSWASEVRERENAERGLDWK